MTEERKPNIYQRLNEIRRAVAYVQKDKQVSGYGYMAVTHDAVTSALREHLITHGVLIVPALESISASPSGTTTGKGIPIIRVEAIYVVEFVNVDEPSDKVGLRVAAHAMDEGDKAPGKAVSYATKYAMLKMFSIETGEDDEDRVKSQISKRVAQEKGKITPAAGTLEALSPDMQTVVMDKAAEVREAFDANNLKEALAILEECNGTQWTAEAKIALWSSLDAKCRREIKKAQQAKLEKK